MRDPQLPFVPTRLLRRPDNDVTLHVSMARFMALRRGESIRAIINARGIPRASLEAPIGRLIFAQTTTSSRFARGMIKPALRISVRQSVCIILFAIGRCQSTAEVFVAYSLTPSNSRMSPY